MQGRGNIGGMIYYSSENQYPQVSCVINSFSVRGYFLQTAGFKGMA